MTLTFAPARTSTRHVLRFELKAINPPEVSSARLYGAHGSKLVRKAVISRAVARGVLEMREDGTRRGGRPRLVIKTNGPGALTPITRARYYVSTNGSDANSGRSPRAAWRTVNRVDHASLSPGDGVLFEGGRSFTDRELSPKRSGNSSRPIVYGSYGSGQARLSRGVYLLDVSGLALQNLEISGAGQAVLASASGRASDITIERMTIHDSRIAINSASSADARWTIRDNAIAQIGDSGMILDGSRFAITTNSIIDTGIDGSIGYAKHGIYLKATDARVTNNTIRGFQASGVSVRYRNSVIEHNDIGDGQVGLAWHQYDAVAGKSYWRYNAISGTTDADIYVSPGDVGGPTRESFVITGNTLSKRSGVYIDRQATRGSYTLSANKEG